MENTHSFATFTEEVSRLTGLFQKKIGLYQTEAYDEMSLRNDFLTPFWRALGWDTENREGLPQLLREVEIETRVDIAGRKKRADYIFRTNGVSKFVCEAKKVKEDLSPKHAYQAQRYAFNLSLFPATLSNFKSLQLFFVGGKPDARQPFPVYLTWDFSEYKAKAHELWNLFSRESVASGSLDKLVADLKKKPIPGKERRGWVWIPERVRTVDDEFLAYIEGQRITLARDLLKQNRRREWDDASLNECIQRILDRVLFTRICEDRDIDTGKPLQQIVADWTDSEASKPSLYSMLIEHFNRLDVSFNGALFKQGHESEKLKVSDSYLTVLIQDLSNEDSPYLFSTLPVEILGSVYERFIGKTVGVTKGGKLRPPEYKPAVRKAGGIYYTPSYIVDYIVEQTVGKQLEGKDLNATAKLRFIDPACGSGSFLIRVFDRVCEHYIRYFQKNPGLQRKELCFSDAQGNLHLTTHLKRQIMLNNIHGVDIDYQAIEVTMLSLYLKILEGETRSSLGFNYTLFPKETFLPDLNKNIRLGNSLIQNDYFDLLSDPEERVAIKAFDWGIEFRDYMKSGGFDAVVGNPPYVTGEFVPDEQIQYLKNHYISAFGKFDLYMVFLEMAAKLSKPNGAVGFIIPNKFMFTKSGKGLRLFLSKKPITEIVDFGDSGVFEGVTNYPCILIVGPELPKKFFYRSCISRPETETRRISVTNNSLGPAPWNFSSGDETIVLDKLAKGADGHLKDVVARFSTGIQTGSDKILIVNQETVKADQLEKEYLRKCLRGRTVKRYAITWDGRSVIWPYNRTSNEILSESDLKRAARHIYKRLTTNKAKLSKRVWFGKNAHELSGEWFGLMYRELDSNFETLHIVSPCLASKCQFALNQDEFRFVTGTAGVLGIIPKDNSRDNSLFLLGLLNSSVTEFFLKRRSPRFAGGFYKFTAPYLKQLPLPSSNSPAKRLQVITHVQALLDASEELPKVKSASAKTTLEGTIRSNEMKLNEIFYSWYGLSPKDISVIEDVLIADLDRNEAGQDDVV